MFFTLLTYSLIYFFQQIESIDPLDRSAVFVLNSGCIRNENELSS